MSTLPLKPSFVCSSFCGLNGVAGLQIPLTWPSPFRSVPSRSFRARKSSRPLICARSIEPGPLVDVQVTSEKVTLTLRVISGAPPFSGLSATK